MIRYGLAFLPNLRPSVCSMLELFANQGDNALGESEILLLKEEVQNRKIVERTIHCAQLVYSSKRGSSDELSTEEEFAEEERKQQGTPPDAGEQLFKFLKEKLPFESTPANWRLLRHLIKALRMCVKVKQTPQPFLMY